MFLIFLTVLRANFPRNELSRKMENNINTTVSFCKYYLISLDIWFHVNLIYCSYKAKIKCQNILCSWTELLENLKTNAKKALQKCLKSATQMLKKGYTNAQKVLHKCLKSATQTVNKRYTNGKQVLQ